MTFAHEQGVVSWHHTAGEPPIDLSVTIGERARTAGPEERITLFIAGWAEGVDSSHAAIEAWEGTYGRPAAAVLMSFCVLPPTKTNLRRIALGVPQTVAEYVGQGRPVNLAMHSLANTAVMSAAEAPELFGAVFADSPQPLSSRHWGPELLRPLVAARRLGDTLLQLRDHRKDERMGRMVVQGRSDVLTFGRRAWSATSFGFSDEISRDTAQSYVTLDAGGHPILVAAGAEDRVVRPNEVQRTLHQTEAANSLPEGHFELVVLPDVPHLPWFLSAGMKFALFDARLRQQEDQSRVA